MKNVSHEIDNFGIFTERRSLLTSICGGVIPGLSAKKGQIYVRFPPVDDRVRFFRG